MENGLWWVGEDAGMWRAEPGLGALARRRPPGQAERKTREPGTQMWVTAPDSGCGAAAIPSHCKQRSDPGAVSAIASPEGELIMGFIKGLSRLGAVLVSLGVVAMAFASHASASTAIVPDPGGVGGTADTAPVPATVVHTIVVGGMPGWQIALIAVATALVAAAAAVLADRARAPRRRLSRTPA